MNGITYIFLINYYFKKNKQTVQCILAKLNFIKICLSKPQYKTSAPLCLQCLHPYLHHIIVYNQIFYLLSTDYSVEVLISFMFLNISNFIEK